MTEGSVPVLAETYSRLVDRIQRRQAAPIGLQGVDDGVGIGVDHRDRPRTAVHGIDTAIAGIDCQVLDVGAGVEHDHGTGGAIDDLHDAEVGERGVRLAIAGVDDNTFGTVRDADLRADTAPTEIQTIAAIAMRNVGTEVLTVGRRNVLCTARGHEENLAVDRLASSLWLLVLAGRRRAATRPASVPRCWRSSPSAASSITVLFAQQAMRAFGGRRRRGRLRVYGHERLGRR